MLIPIENLVDSVARTLLEAVLPHVRSSAARAQLYAAVDVLRNLRDRIEEKQVLLEQEARSAQSALERAAERLRECGRAELANNIDAWIAEVPLEPLTMRVEALRSELAAALELIDGVPDAAAEEARAALGAHLAAQALRDVSVLKPSMLGEISRG